MVHMGTTRPLATPAPATVDHFVAAPATVAPEEPIERLTCPMPRRLRLQCNQEAATRDGKKQALLREMFECYFARKATD